MKNKLFFTLVFAVLGIYSTGMAQKKLHPVLKYKYNAKGERQNYSAAELKALLLDGTGSQVNVDVLQEKVADNMSVQSYKQGWHDSIPDNLRDDMYTKLVENGELGPEETFSKGDKIISGVIDQNTLGEIDRTNYPGERPFWSNARISYPQYLFGDHWVLLAMATCGNPACPASFPPLPQISASQDDESERRGEEPKKEQQTSTEESGDATATANANATATGGTVNNYYYGSEPQQQQQGFDYGYQPSLSGGCFPQQQPCYESGFSLRFGVRKYFGCIPGPAVYMDGGYGSSANCAPPPIQTVTNNTYNYYDDHSTNIYDYSYYNQVHNITYNTNYYGDTTHTTHGGPRNPPPGDDAVTDNPVNPSGRRANQNGTAYMGNTNTTATNSKRTTTAPVTGVEHGPRTTNGTNVNALTGTTAALAALNSVRSNNFTNGTASVNPAYTGNTAKPSVSQPTEPVRNQRGENVTAYTGASSLTGNPRTTNSYTGANVPSTKGDVLPPKHRKYENTTQTGGEATTTPSQNVRGTTAYMGQNSTTQPQRGEKPRGENVNTPRHADPNYQASGTTAYMGQKKTPAPTPRTNGNRYEQKKQYQAPKYQAPTQQLASKQRTSTPAYSRPSSGGGSYKGSGGSYKGRRQ